MEPIFQFEDQMNQRLSPCSDYSAYKIAQDYLPPFSRRADAAQYGLARVCEETSIVVKDNTHTGCLRVLRQVAVN